MANPLLNKTTPTMLAVWQQKFENYIRLTQADSTYRRYADAVENFLGHFKNRKNPQDFIRADVEDYKLMRLKKGKAVRTVNLEIVAVRMFFQFMKDAGVEPLINPASGIKPLKEPEIIPTFIPLATIDKLMKVCEDVNDKLLVLLSVSTGCRAQEMVKLQKSDFNLEDKILIVPAEITKSKRSRRLELRQDVVDLVSSLPPGRIFAAYADNYNQLYQRWRRLFWRAELKPVGLHATRRTYATLMHRAGCDQATLKERLGHRSIVTTGRYLAAEEVGAVRDLVEAMPIG